ncbi:MAG: FkbM family methyltransferase [Candidatus Campbellbacteria bacterium]|nr:FkbM family methyltransferase [Candidatus Campbellbacteria bacterium]
MNALFHKKVKTLSEITPSFFFIQIGAKGGGWPDPIRRYVLKYNWQGIFVEPIPYWFKKLKKTYTNALNVSFENVAIAEENTKRVFYHVRESNWYLRLIGGSLSSFSKENILKHVRWWRPPGLRSNIIESTLNCLSFNTLLQKYGVQKIDLLVIDTEGYDFKILAQVPFNRIRPSMIYYEHKHLSAEEKTAGEILLKSNGYQFKNGVRNTFAWTN